MQETSYEIIPQIKQETEDGENGGQEIVLEQIFNRPLKAIKKKTVASNKKKKSPVTLDDDTKKSLTKILFDEEDQKIKEFFDLTCYQCTPNVSHDTLLEYKMHCKSVHNDPRAAIVCCSRKLTKRYSVLEHLNYHVNPDKFKCKDCNRLYADKKSLKIHLTQQHGNIEDKPFECDHCGKRFVRLEPLRLHLRSHLSEEEKQKLRTHLCNECGSTFISQHVLKSHIKYSHLKMGFYCEQCAKHYKAKLDYDLHRRNIHGEAGPARVQCDECSKWFSHEKAMRKHKAELHRRESGPIICSVCGMETTSKPALRSHMKMKHTERTFRCEYCHKAFQTSTRLKEHLPVHTGISLYNCRYCEKTFNGSSNMYKHLKAIHPVEWARDKIEKNVHPEKFKKENV